MNKIILTERQKKLLEDYKQLDDNRKEIFHFNSKIETSYIDIIDLPSEWDIDDSNLNLDWDLLINTNENGFNLSTKFNYINGTINLYKSGLDGNKVININKSWVIENNDIITDSHFDIKEHTVYISLNKQKIKIT